MPLWWLSFCDGDRPEGQQFLGVSVVDGFNLASAAANAHRLGCNPGGEVMGIEAPEDMIHMVPESYRNRLLTRSEAEELDKLMGASGPS